MFGWSKPAPPPGLLIDIFSETTFIGDEFTPRSIRAAWKAGGAKRWLDNPVTKNMLFMAAQDITDAIRFQSLDGGFASNIGAMGASTVLPILGVSQYTPELKKWEELHNKKEELGQMFYGLPWDNLNSEAQETLKANHPELEILKRQAAFEGREIRKASLQEEAARRVQENLEPKNQEELKRLEMHVSGLSRNFGDWRLNDERYERYKQLTAFIVNRELSDVIGSGWQTYSDSDKRTIIKDIINAAKAEARDVVKDEANR